EDGVGGNGGIDRRSTLRQNLGARRRGLDVTGGNDAITRDHHGASIGAVLGGYGSSQGNNSGKVHEEGSHGHRLAISIWHLAFGLFSRFRGRTRIPQGLNAQS